MTEPISPSNPPAKFIGRYRIVRELARSNDIVYEAADPTMNRRVALKQLNLPANLSGEQKRERIERFKREAKAAGTLNHRNIVTIYEISQDKDVFFIAMEYLSGQSLRNYMSVNGPLPVRLSMMIGLEMCDALGYAHSKNIVHRDVKPDNVHLVPPDNSVKLTDFGIARVMEEPSLTATGQVFGTPSYMSPEQLSARKVDHRTDLFSLGVMMYEILTGRKPFHGDNIVSVTYQIMNSPVTFPAGMPAGITAILRRALSKDPDQRYQNAAAMAADIRSELVLHEAPHSVTVSIPAEATTKMSAGTAAPVPLTDAQQQAISAALAPGIGADDATVLVGATVAATSPPVEVSAQPAVSQGATVAASSVSTPTTGSIPPTAATGPQQTPSEVPLFNPEIYVPPKNSVAVLVASVTSIVVLVGLMIWAITFAYKSSIRANERVAAVNACDAGGQALESNHPADAITEYAKAISLAGANSDIILQAKHGLASAYVDQGDTQAAANDLTDATVSYQAAIQNDPTDAKAHYGLAQISDGSAKLSELDAAINYDPSGHLVPTCSS